MRNAFFYVFFVIFTSMYFISCNEKKQEQKEIQSYEDSIKSNQNQDEVDSKKAAADFITQVDTTAKGNK